MWLTILCFRGLIWCCSFLKVFKNKMVSYSLPYSNSLSNDLIPATAVAHTSSGIDDGEVKKIAQGSRSINNLRASCLDIKEPEANGVEELISTGMEAHLAAILERYIQKWTERTKHNLGYQVNLKYDYDNLNELLKYSINNAGDPFVEGNYGIHSRDFEIGVLDWFARLWEINKDDYWGYVTNGGTEGNLHGILVGREMFPDGILYTSKESHHSVFKAAYMYRMECNMIKTMVSGEIDCRDLKFRLLQNKDKPAIMNINIGTTVKGAVDDLDLVIQTLEECGFQRNRFYIHCDGALFGIMLPFFNHVPKITFKKPIDSVSVSGHKFVGCPLPCGIQIVRVKHIDGALSKKVEYLASSDATITCSRNGHTSIFLWYTLSRKGYNGLRKEVQKCLHNAQYLKARLKRAGVSVMLNEPSNMVVFERPQDDVFVRHWQLACQGNIAHVAVMPNVTIEMLDCFMDNLVAKRLIWFGEGGNNQPPCVASQIGKENCACSLHK